MNINWKVRIKSPQFWTGLVGAAGVCAVAVANALGFTLDITEWSEAANSIIAGVFTILTLVGVVADPTTQGVCDSSQAMEYTAPKPKTEAITEE